MGSLDNLAGRRVYLDANVFIYALSELSPWSVVAQAVLRAVENEAIAGVTSELTLAECLVKPLQMGAADAIGAFEQSVRSRRQLTVAPVNRAILIEAARVRAESGARLPDAIHVATSRAERCDVFMTNDRRLAALPGLNAVLLSGAAVID
jgi:predicted nucleic acid-binding protein